MEFRAARSLGQVSMSIPQSACPDVSSRGITGPAPAHADYRQAGLRRVQPQSGIGSSDDDWPRHSFLELSALPTAASCARAHATAMLAKWGLPDLRDDAEIVTSELATNAFLASAPRENAPPAWDSGPALIRLWLLADVSRLLIVVWDAARQPPTPVQPAELDEHGRGLLLVSELSSRWGYYERPGTQGKFTWVEFQLRRGRFPA
jgi:anti-sigma regulatory factor (Ser/Thr protein kinase)